MTSALAGAVVVGLLVTGMPTAQAAGTAYQPYGSVDLLTVGSHQYFDVYGTQPRDISDPSLFLRDVLTSTVPAAGGMSMAGLWGDLARTIYFAIPANVVQVQQTVDHDGGTIAWQNGPVTEAASLAAADQQIRNAVGVPSGKAANSDIADDTTNQTVFYQLRMARKPTFFQTAGIAVMYYDFKLGYLNAGTSMKSAPPGPDNTVTSGAPDVSYSGGVQNQSSLPVQASQSLQQTTTQDITNSVTSMEQFSHTQALEYTTELTTPLSGVVGGGKESIKLALSATELFSKSETTSKTTSTSTSGTGAVSVALPPNTGALISQSTTRSTFLAKYDYPVAVQYKVKVVEYGLFQSSDLLNPFTYVDQTLTTFGDNPAGEAFAADNLQARYENRAVPGYESAHGSGLGWAVMAQTGATAVDPLQTGFRNLFGDTTTYNYPQTLDRLINVRPMSLTGGVLSGTSTTIASNVAAITPIYPLDRVTTTQQRPVTMQTGDQLYTDDIPLRGINRYFVDYYGFNPKRGHWVVLDSAGVPAPTSPVAQLSTNPLTGTTTLKAGDTPGTVYLKYLIDDDFYTYGDQTGAATTNADLTSTAVVPVAVSPRPFAGSISVSGSLTGYVADPALTISGQLKAMLLDPTGLQVDRPVTWQAQEIPSSGVQVVDNKITFTATGTFHVRAVVDSLYSPWVAVTARPKRALTSIVVADPLHVLTVRLTKGGSTTVDLTRLTVVGKDQYNVPFPLPSSRWVPSGTGVSVLGKVLTIKATGTFGLSLIGGGVRSNSLPVQATLINRRLRFYTGGGTVIAPLTVPDGTVVDLSKYRPTRYGNYFLGWFRDATLTTRVGTLTVRADTTVYAGWHRYPWF